MKSKHSNYRSLELLPGLILFTAFIICKQGLGQVVNKEKDKPRQTNLSATAGKPISPDLFGVFFEDLSYAADGGLYAELVQNRSFEYSASDKKTWNPLTAWEYTTKGYGYGTISIETSNPVNVNNPHYVVLDVDYPGQEGVGLINSGYDGINLKAGAIYDFPFTLTNYLKTQFRCKFNCAEKGTR